MVFYVFFKIFLYNVASHCPKMLCWLWLFIFRTDFTLGMCVIGCGSTTINIKIYFYNISTTCVRDSDCKVLKIFQYGILKVLTGYYETSRICVLLWWNRYLVYAKRGLSADATKTWQTQYLEIRIDSNLNWKLNLDQKMEKTTILILVTALPTHIENEIADKLARGVLAKSLIGPERWWMSHLWPLPDYVTDE